MLSGGWSNWEETPGQKRDTLEELLYIRIRIRSLSWSGNEEEVAREKDILVCCHHDPVPGLVEENGWMDVIWSNYEKGVTIVTYGVQISVHLWQGIFLL